MGLLKSFLAVAFTWFFAFSCLGNGVIAAPPTGEFSTPNVVYCSPHETTAGSKISKNMKAALDYLAALNSSFYISGTDPDQIYGFYECYTPGNCSQCFRKITDDFSNKCPLATGAREYVIILPYTYSCFLRYERENFFSEVNFTESAAAPPTSSVNNTSSQASQDTSKRTKVILGVVVPSVALLLAAAGLATYVAFCKPRGGKLIRGGLRAGLAENLYLPQAYRSYSYEELRLATMGFAEDNKLGQGGYGAVYKAVLPDGKEVAVKKLLLNSNRGNDEFVNEVKIISSIQHRNLVRLEGYCVEAMQKLLVLEYVVNGSLEKALFGIKASSQALDWPTRGSIILGIAGGLRYLHEESHIQIIHRDIKASNVLLDNKLKPKIADFGISKLYDKDASVTTTTNIAGTYGYLAPEYAIGGNLTAKIDVFSFGVLVLEIISGRRCNDPSLPEDQELLLERAWKLHSYGDLEDLIDPRLGLSLESSKSGALKAVHIALLCTQADAVKRPTMSLVVAMLQDHRDIPPLPEQPATYTAREGFSRITG